MAGIAPLVTVEAASEKNLLAAVAITEAFHESMKSAPLPKRNEKNMASIITLTLLKKMCPKNPIFTAFPVNSALRVVIVCACTLKTVSEIFVGKTILQTLKATVSPKKKKRKNTIV